MPGLGIVAAVLGVVITMGPLGGPPEEIGHKVAAALVGTFLGILLCYGFVGPIAANMAKSTEEEHAFYHVIRVVIVAFIKGSPPSVAVEFGAARFRAPCGRNFRNSRTTSRIVVQQPKAQRQRNQSRRQRRDFQCRRLRQSSSRKRPGMADTMEAPGRWRTPILLPP